MDTSALTVVGTICGVGFGLGGLIVGIVGLTQAHQARTRADESNRIAGEANELVRQSIARETERHDVTWEWRWDQQKLGYIEIQNIGKDRALDVIAQFFFGDVVEANLPMEIPGRDILPFVIPGLEELRTQALNAPVDARYSLPARSSYKAKTRLRVTWKTPLGTPKEHDTGWVDSPLA